MLLTMLIVGITTNYHNIPTILLKVEAPPCSTYIFLRFYSTITYLMRIIGTWSDELTFMRPIANVPIGCLIILSLTMNCIEVAGRFANATIKDITLKITYPAMTPIFLSSASDKHITTCRNIPACTSLTCICVMWLPLLARLIQRFSRRIPVVIPTR
ncbi:hypothetical protein HMPREF3055_03205 [Rothia sp. HMSC061C12]|nr:hypothetical protein HMPREF3055_03205 [Rothia sp. HMSC061C12]